MACHEKTGSASGDHRRRGDTRALTRRHFASVAVAALVCILAGPAAAQQVPGGLPSDVNPIPLPGAPIQVPAGLGLGPVELEGLRNARIFDPRTMRFTQVGHMPYGRWYMSTVRLGDGQVFGPGGVTKLINNTELFTVRPTETFNPATGQWAAHEQDLGVHSSLPLYPRLRL